MFKFIAVFALVAVASAAPGFITESHHSFVQPAVYTKTAVVDTSASSAITHQSFTNLEKKVPVVKTAAAPVVKTVHTYEAAPVLKTLHTYESGPVLKTVSYASAPVVKTIAAAPVVHTYASAPVVKTVSYAAPVVKTVATPVVHTYASAPVLKTFVSSPVTYAKLHH
ncbi:uncharacterized protein LOC135954745 [Calliphora vicina]|uniref:uncharacterized protein LOC135954745 n=1 Tax=Calliphora vicina TaxID=7373 RepID=UPI00325AC95E